MSVKVSVIVPVYNLEKYIHKCLNSLIYQTLKEIEIIIVDDGSEDNTFNICEKYAKKDKRIKLFSQKNSGQGAARNFAFKQALGEFLFCVDGDDWIEFNTLETLYDTAMIESSDVVICGWQRIDEKDQIIVQTRKDIFDFKPFTNEEKNHYIFSRKLSLMACSTLIKREIITKHKLKYPNILHEDLYFMPKVYYYAKHISIVHHNFYNWLIRENSTTNSFSLKQAYGLVGISYAWRDFLKKEELFENLKPSYIKGVFEYLNLYLYRMYTFAKPIEKKELLNIFVKVLLDVDELKEFRQYLSSSDIKRYHKVIHFYDYLLPTNQAYLRLIDIAKEKKTDNKLFTYDIVFMPHKDYQLWTMALISQELSNVGISSCILDLTDYYKDERVREAIKQYPSIPFFDLSYFLNEQINYKAIVCMNDWDSKVTRPIIQEAKKNGKLTIGIIEGINDFYDLDTKRERFAYQTVEYLFMTGEHDKQFFKDKKDKSFVIGVPRLSSLLQEKPIFPEKPLAVVNLNFSYGVLEDKREMWLESVIEGCKKAGIDYVITQHPADKADLSNYNVSEKNMYDTIREGSIIISRFGSIIIEALAMGKPAIYHNPHGEKVLKFQEPMGAYSLSFDSDSLAEAIKYELSLNVDYRKRANRFLDFHANINAKKSSSLIATELIEKILKEKNDI